MAYKLDYTEARHYALKSIRDFLTGEGGEWDWDDFTSIPLGFSELRDLQQFCAYLSITYPERGRYCSEEGMELLRGKLKDLENNTPTTRI
ncbi:MAG: hypothetical protein ABI833_09525 [Acidobacteriota bacterium]